MIVLNVTYNIDGEEINCDLNIFAPNTMQDITSSIINRALSEKQTRINVEMVKSLSAQIEIGQILTIN
jgi:hypothetical protein